MAGRVLRPLPPPGLDFRRRSGAQKSLVKTTLIVYIAMHRSGSAKLTGGAPGLQIRCRGVKAFLGGFDSHALPPSYASPFANGPCNAPGCASRVCNCIAIVRTRRQNTHLEPAETDSLPASAKELPDKLYSLKLKSLKLIILCSPVGAASCRNRLSVAARCRSYQSEAFNP
jgi:hypothetical protein